MQDEATAPHQQHEYGENHRENGDGSGDPIVLQVVVDTITLEAGVERPWKAKADEDEEDIRAKHIGNRHVAKALLCCHLGGNVAWNARA